MSGYGEELHWAQTLQHLDTQMVIIASCFKGSRFFFYALLMCKTENAVRGFLYSRRLATVWEGVLDMTGSAAVEDQTKKHHVLSNGTEFFLTSANRAAASKKKKLQRIPPEFIPTTSLSILFNLWAAEAKEDIML